MSSVRGFFNFAVIQTAIGNLKAKNKSCSFSCFLLTVWDFAEAAPLSMSFRWSTAPLTGSWASQSLVFDIRRRNVKPDSRNRTGCVDTPTSRCADITPLTQRESFLKVTTISCKHFFTIGSYRQTFGSIWYWKKV